ncbi:pectin lyase fold/virulence factor [Flammula alnicola]|nr:pectin lyase fold/virulence factor [Flammula alnicola]
MFTFSRLGGPEKTCHLRPLGHGHDDTNQVEAAIAKCGHFGTISFDPGSYNITRKMTWDLVSSKVDLRGYLNFPPDIQFWLNANNTYRVVFIQSQASWFVVTGSDFEIDAHNTGGIQGNGQPWWSYFATHTREDGDGRPISLTLWKVTRGIIKNFRIESPPFWSNAVAQSTDVTYDGMFINATNTDPYIIVPNTDGRYRYYRSDRVSLLNWDVTCGDDCIAIKEYVPCPLCLRHIISTTLTEFINIDIRNITCRGGNGVAIGSLGQYVNMMIRLDSSVQPNMESGVYFKSWDGSVNGAPPTGGGGANGTAPVHVYQTNNALTGDLPSKLKFEGLHFVGWTGTAITNKIVDIECSPAVGCNNITFEDFNVTPPSGQAPRFICQNTVGVVGLSGA